MTRARAVPAKTRGEAVAYAAEHGDAAAAVRYGVKVGTVKAWRSRSGSAEVPKVQAPTVQAVYRIEDMTSATVLRAGCSRCGRQVPVRAGELAAVFARRAAPVCQRCQARTRPLRLVPRPEWEADLLVAGDLLARSDR